MLEYDGGVWTVNGRWRARNVINTAPWCDLYDALGRPAELAADFAKIRYNRLVISLYELRYDVDWHWRYIPDRDVSYHREFYIGNFAEDSRRDGVYTETNARRYSESCVHRGPGKHIYSAKTDAAYPIPVIGHAAAIDNILKHYAKMNMFGVGRWGQHSYQNADVSMYEAFKFVDSIR